MKNVTLNNLMKKYGKPVLVVLIFAILGALVMGVDAKKKKSTTYTASRQIVISHNIPQEMRTMSSGANISIVGEDCDSIFVDLLAEKWADIAVFLNQIYVTAED